MLVNIVKLNPSAVIPLYAKEGDAGMDLTAVSADFSNEEYVEYGTGLCMEIPEGYMGLIFPRSSNSKKDLQLCNSVGVIDSGYRGEIKLRFRRIINPGDGRCYVRPNKEWVGEIYELHPDFKMYEVGDKVGQIIIMPVPFVSFMEVDRISSTERGEGGFGSSGK